MRADINSDVEPITRGHVLGVEHNRSLLAGGRLSGGDLQLSGGDLRHDMILTPTVEHGETARSVGLRPEVV